MNAQALQRLAKKALRKRQQLRADPRFRQTVGKFVAGHLLTHTTIPPYRGPVAIEDALWAGELEPRILELLPAVCIKKPRFLRIKTMPDDLKAVLQGIRKGNAEKPFRGIPAKDYLKWIKFVGHQKLPTILKTFRFSQADQEALKKTAERLNVSESAALRMAIQKFYA